MNIMDTNAFTEIFTKCGFVKEYINDCLVFSKNGSYYKISYIKDMNGYVIESTNSKEDASKNLYEDSDFIKQNDKEKVLLELEKVLGNIEQ